MRLLIHGWQAVVALMVATLFAFNWIRTSFYEVFAKVHLMAVTALVVFLWWHTKESKQARICLIICTSLSSFTHLLTWVQRLFRNFGWNRRRTRIEVRHGAGALQITAYVCRPWKVRAGQFVYLSVPTASFSSAFQYHPFVISHWEHNDSDEESLTLHFLVQPQRGFTRRLLSNTNTLLSATVDGPFGVSLDLGDYGTVFLFATGFGIASHLSYISELVRGYRQYEVRTRQIILVWRLDTDSASFSPGKGN